MTRRRITVMGSEILGVPGTGGPGTADSLLAVALARRGHEVELLVAPGRDVRPLSPDWERIYHDARVRVRRLEGSARVRPPFLGPTTELFDNLRADPPDVVVADDWRALAYAALRSRQLGVALPDTAFVVYCHGPARVLAEAARKVPDTLARFGEEVAERACLELADVVVSPSRWLLDWMRARGWRVPETARVVQNLWQSTALGEPPARTPEAAAVRRLAFFGQLREGKGIGVFVDSLRLLEAHLLQGVELLFLGRETPRWTTERVRQGLGAEAFGQVASLRFETGLERSAALQELLQPGTLAVMPSLLENSPYAVAECIEHGIPFVAARTGGVPELVAEADQDRVLFSPTPDELARVLGEALSSRSGFAPARPARPPGESLETWLDLVEHVVPTRAQPTAPATRVGLVARGEVSVRRAHRLAERTQTVEVDVVSAPSRSAGVERTSADWVVFLDDEDSPDDGMLDALVAAQAASAADVVTAAVRPADGLEDVQLFLGDPAALGLVENQYGVLGLVRRSLATAQRTLDGGTDPDWLLFARLALSGARVVSIPEPLAVHGGRPGSVGDVPGEGLAVLDAFEQVDSAFARDLPQLTATLAAANARLESRDSVSGAGPGTIERTLRALRAKRVLGVLRRAWRSASSLRSRRRTGT